MISKVLFFLLFIFCDMIPGYSQEIQVYYSVLQEIDSLKTKLMFVVDKDTLEENKAMFKIYKDQNVSLLINKSKNDKYAYRVRCSVYLNYSNEKPETVKRIDSRNYYKNLMINLISKKERECLAFLDIRIEEISYQNISSETDRVKSIFPLFKFLHEYNNDYCIP